MTEKKLTLQGVFATSVNMGNGMNKILPGLYVGNFRDAKDDTQLTENNITHIVSIHDNAKKLLEDKEYLCIIASDTPDQDLSKYFPQVSRFIHKARLDGGAVLVHCLAGVSRSVTVTAAYIMTTTELGWRDSLNTIRGARSVANPNFGFQKQLQHFENEHIIEERKRFRAQFPHNPFRDEEDCRVNMHCFHQYIMTGNLPSRSDDLYPLPHKAYRGHYARKEEELGGGSSEQNVDNSENGSTDVASTSSKQSNNSDKDKSTDASDPSKSMASLSLDDNSNNNVNALSSGNNKHRRDRLVVDDL